MSTLLSDHKIVFDLDLINRYDKTGPRYTSYPTAVQFTEAYAEKDYRNWADESNNDPIPAPLSLYLKKEIKLQSELFSHDRTVLQMHWGGGTPSYLKNEHIKELLDCIHQNFTLADDKDGELAIEVDPRTVDVDRIHTLRALGFNRISFGVQDFNPEVQDAINRVNSKEQIISVINAANDAGFHSINIDLMYGLPKQTIARFAETITATIEARPDRIAVYK